MKRCSQNRGVSLRIVIFHIIKPLFFIFSLPFQLEQRRKLRRCLLMIPSTSPPSTKRCQNLKDSSHRSCFTRLLIALSFFDPPNHKHCSCPALIIIQKSNQKAINNPKAHNPLILSCRPSNVIPYFIRGEQQKIIMGISMSQSQEIRRLKLHDLQYKQRSLVRFHSSSPVQFRGIENQQVDNKAKPKQLITEPSFKARPQQPESRINQTLNYELDMDLQQVNPRAKAKGKGGQRLRQSNPVKENSYSEVLRISKAKEDHENQAHPQTMRSRKVKVGKK